MPDRPNILFLMDDEHRPDVLGYAGNDVVRTPNLDRLAADAVRFENAYTPSPACMPARQCLTTGQLPRTCGCLRYGEDIPPQSMTFPRRLAQYAYETTCAGKLHHSGADKAQGWLNLLDGGGTNVDIIDEAADERYNQRTSGQKWSDAKEIRRAGVGKPGVGWRSRSDELSVAGAIKEIESKYLDPYYDREDPTRPITLKVSLRQPHYPYLTSEDKFTYYLNRVEPYLDEDRFDHPYLSRQSVYIDDDRHADAPNTVTPREVRRATAAYYGMIETVDELYGRVLDKLEAAGQDLDEWIIVFTADHGEMLGQHGVWEKPHFYEECAGIPLFIRCPDRFEPKVVEENVNLCDLFATLCDLAGVPVPADHTLDSRSMVPLLEGDSNEWTGTNDETVSAFGDQIMIKRGDLKYIHVSEASDVLFDLAADPNETENRIDDPGYADAVDTFQTRRDELGYGPAPDPEYQDAGYDHGVPTAP